MIFRNIFFSALFAGVIAGVVYGLYQQAQITPLIHAAEQYEVSDESVNEVASDGHSHSHDGWSPSDGIERLSYSMVSNVLVGISFSLFLIALMVLHNFKSSKPRVSALSGLGWGIAVMLSVFVAPALLGMHPEVPGTVAAPLASRQTWWLFCVFGTAAGLAMIYYGKIPLKASGIALIALPHIVGAPLPEHPGFVNPDPAAVEALSALTARFYTQSAIGMVIFCLAIGVLCGYATKRFIKLDAAA